jgi:sialidase-1
MRHLAPLLFLLSIPAAAAPDLTQMEVFRSGEGGYHTYRIPALIASKKGTLLAFCEGRRNSGSDTGDIDILLRRSFDNGKTWSPVQLIADFEENTIGNPAPVIDRKSGDIVLLLTSNPGNVPERQIGAGLSGATRTVWIMRSSDDGQTWTKPADITASTKRADWTWYATGPGNGIQLRDGRLVIPCDHNVAVTKARHSHVIVSDDGGHTWKIGGVAGENTNESAVAELRDGSLIFNMRSYHGKNRRVIAYSKDRGESWSELKIDEALIEPVCQASLIRAGKGLLLFSNPADVKRIKMTVKVSRDGGRAWGAGRLLHAGPSAYSSLAEMKNGRIGLLYERGEKRPYEWITFAAFPVRWAEKVK